MNKQLEALQSQYDIEKDVKNDALLSVLSDKYCRSILEATMDKPKSVTELAAETKIPISTIYRRTQALHDNKLLHISGMISDDGKKFFLYKSKIKGFKSRYDEGKIEVELEFNK